MTDASDRSAAVARESTRGVAIITVAKAYFLLTGFAQPILLTRILGQSGYGLYGSVLNAISILNNVVVAGSIQAMSKAVSESGRSALRRGLVLHAGIGLALALLVVLTADVFGREALHDAQLPPLLRIGAIVVGDYCVYAALVGALNGERRFREQALLDMTFATLRTGLVIGLAATRWRVTGAVAGFALASLLIVFIAGIALQRGAGGGAKGAAAAKAEGGNEWAVSFGAFARKYAWFFVPVLLYQLALNMVLQADLLVLKAMLARVHHLGESDANALVGVYKAVQNFAFLPYQLLIAVTFVVFPVVTTATREGDRETTQRLFAGALRFSVLALGAMLAILAGAPERVLRLAYRPEMAAGAGALRALSLGQGAFSLSVITTTVVLAAGKTRAATLLMMFMLAAVFAGDAIGIGLAQANVTALNGAAAGTALGCLAGLVAIGLYARKTFGAFVPALTLVRATAAALLAGAFAAFAPLPGKVGTLIIAAMTVGIYLLGLLLTGEVSRSEREGIAKLVRRLAKR